MVTDLIIPALDEIANIEPLFDAIDGESAHLRRVILADNGSTDGTAEAAAARGAIVVKEFRRGYGAACLAALRWIEENDDPPDVVAFLDADLADDPAALGLVLAPLAANDADLVIGSRVRHATPGALNIPQRFGNRLACAMIYTLGGKQFSDLGPFRAVRWSTLQRLAMADRTWGWTVEMQMKAGILDIRATEVDVPYRTRREGRSKISGTVRGVLAAGTKIILTIVQLWWARGAIAAADRQRPQPNSVQETRRRAYPQGGHDPEDP